MSIELITQSWRQNKAEEQSAFAAGEISAEDCCMDRLFPEAFIDRTEALLKDLLASIAKCPIDASGFHQVMQSIETLVVGLNQINEDFDGEVIETGEREELCAFIDEVIAARGIDLDALAAFQGCGPGELTDPWRDW
jgi:hypothetical protein